MHTEKPAAEALAEWNRWDELRVVHYSLNNDAAFDECQSKLDSLSAHLDKMCEKAGLSIVDGRLRMTKFDGEETDGEYDSSYWTAQWINDPDEFIALLLWLRLISKRKKS